jgi:pyridoxal 5'-phosphate synthase pdxT subunit
MKVGVLGLQGDVREHARALDDAGATPLIVKHPEELALVDAVVVPGGESTTIGKLLRRYGLLNPLEDRVRAGMPLFGTCAGLILMARDVVGPQGAPDRLGVMDVALTRNAYGRQIASFESDISVKGLAKPLHAVFIRAPVIEKVGAGVEVLASHEARPVLVREGPLLGATFHPEIGGDPRIHLMFVEMTKRG